MRRFCCEVLKERVGIGKRVFGGMRQDESSKRSSYEPEMCDGRSCMKGTKHLLPILTWTEEDVWAYIKERGLPYMKYYDKPYCFKRHGCVACPLANAKTRVKEYRIFPKWALVDMKNVAEFMNTHPDSVVANTFEDEWEAFYFWIWGKSIDNFKGLKFTLFGKTDFKSIIKENIGL